MLKTDSHITENTLRLHYEGQLINGVYGNKHCLFWETHKTR
jgi:hypothetical protein